MKTDDLVKVINYWQEVAEEAAVLPRDIIDKIDLKSKKITVLTGVRRSGKSSVLRYLFQKVSRENPALYINFEDPFFVLNNGPQIIEEVIESYQEYFSADLKFVFFDEIQNIKNWEKAVRKYEEAGKIKIFVSGSSAKLLAGEYATLLTGRHQSYELFPLSFKEYLRFEKMEIKSKKDRIVKDEKLKRCLREYLQTGGFPEVVLTKNTEYAKQYFADILQKDIIGRFDLRQKETITEMAAFLLSNSGNLVSLSSLRRLYQLAFPAVVNYLDYFSQAYLLFFVPQFSFSIKRRQKALKKVYGVDTGLLAAVSLSYSADWGRMLETAVFLELKRRGHEVFYYKTAANQEVDFVYKDGKNLTPLQICWDLDNEKTKKRETSSLTSARKELKTDKGFILTAESAVDWFLF